MTELETEHGKESLKQVNRLGRGSLKYVNRLGTDQSQGTRLFFGTEHEEKESLRSQGTQLGSQHEKIDVLFTQFMITEDYFKRSRRQFEREDVRVRDDLSLC